MIESTYEKALREEGFVLMGADVSRQAMDACDEVLDTLGDKTPPIPLFCYKEIALCAKDSGKIVGPILLAVVVDDQKRLWLNLYIIGSDAVDLHEKYGFGFLRDFQTQAEQRPN